MPAFTRGKCLNLYLMSGYFWGDGRGKLALGWYFSFLLLSLLPLLTSRQFFLFPLLTISAVLGSFAQGMLNIAVKVCFKGPETRLQMRSNFKDTQTHEQVREWGGEKSTERMTLWRKRFAATNTDKNTRYSLNPKSHKCVCNCHTEDTRCPGSRLPGYSTFRRGLLTSLLLCREKWAEGTEEGTKGDLKVSPLTWDESAQRQITSVTTTINSKWRVSKIFCFCQINPLALSLSSSN